MKTITLLPVKNEGWILETTLKNMSEYSDHIIIADQHSTDSSREIYARFEKVIVIENNNTHHSNSIRWKLLDCAREKFGINNLIICVDADEMLSPQAVIDIKTSISEKLLQDKDTESISVAYGFPWIQLWGGTEKHRTDSVWKHNIKEIAFYDTGHMDYERKTVLNDHTGRVPLCQEHIVYEQHPLLHYQYINLEQSTMKQAWYMCSERIQGNSPRKINHKYAVAMNTEHIHLEPVPKTWMTQIPTISFTYTPKTDWRYLDIVSWFATYNISYFEALAIWHIQEFADMFMTQTKRKPKPSVFPSWLIYANNLKNYIKHILHRYI